MARVASPPAVIASLTLGASPSAEQQSNVAVIGAALGPVAETLVARATLRGPRAKTPPSPQRQEQIKEAFFNLTNIYWVQYTIKVLLPKKAFSDASDLLNEHGTALQGVGDKLTEYGRDSMQSNTLALKTYSSRIIFSRKTLQDAGYDLSLVQSPRVQALVAADLMLSTWKAAARNKRVSEQNLSSINGLVARRKSEFVQALRDYDKAFDTHDKYPGKPETTRLAYEKNRLQEANRALQAVTRALFDQVDYGDGVDVDALQPQFGSNPPLVEWGHSGT